MKKLLVILMLFAPLGAFAQPVIGINMKLLNDNIVAVEVVNDGYGSYSIVFRFDKQNIFDVLSHRESNIIYQYDRTILKPVGDPSCQIFQGIVNPPNVDRDFVYALPYVAGKERRLFKGIILQNVLYRSFSPITTQFLMQEGDTVCAMRKGMVVRIVDGKGYDPSTGRPTKEEVNEHYLVVEHADGTLATYALLAPKSAMVNLGDIVYPGTPLARVKSSDGKTPPWLNVSLSYLQSNLIQTSPIPRMLDVKHIEIAPIFRTSEGDVRITDSEMYRSATDEELITKEMTNREKKARQRKK